MDIVSILGLGAIGLDFLLAYLTYRLLEIERKNDKPIYVYQFFCFALVLIEAYLQYLSTTDNEKIKNLQSINEKLNSELINVKTKLKNTKLNYMITQKKAEKVEGKLNHSILVMKNIAGAVPKSIENLKAVNVVLTGKSCAGGSSGVPIWGGRGIEMAALSTAVMSNLAAAKSSIESVLQE